MPNLQDNFLNRLRNEKTPVVVYPTNGVRLRGVRLRGVIRAFDNFVVIPREARQRLIYKPAISAIVHDTDARLNPDDDEAI